MKYRISNKNIFRSKQNLIRIIIISSFVVLLLVASFFIYKFIFQKSNKNMSMRSLKESWKVYDYESVYEISKYLLTKNAFNNVVRTYHGYASFFLSVSSLDKLSEKTYLDESINSLRIALMDSKKSLQGQLEYMLGKAYFHKNTVTSYYYADLAVKYLQQAKAHGYEADDIAEYLGLSYAALDMKLDSIASFTEALLVRESDTLLFHIAEQYFESGQNTTALQYLFRITKESDDENLLLKSRMLLGNIYISQEKYEEAKEEFLAILQKKENFADAHYKLGIIYEKQGDMVKARASWRNALRFQVNHQESLEKLAE